MGDALLLLLAGGCTSPKPADPGDPAETGMLGDSSPTYDSCPTPYPGYQDADGDGWGDPGSPVEGCEATAVAVAGDCDDADPGVNPGADDLPGDGIDQDCDGTGRCDGERVVFDGDLEVTGDGSEAMLLDFCTGYEGLTGRVLVEETSLTDLSALSCLCEAGSIEITHNDALTSLAGLEGLTDVERLRVVQNPLLAEFGGLRNLTYAGEVSVGANSGESELHGLENLTVVGTGASCTSNGTDPWYERWTCFALSLEDVHSLAGLAGLTTVDGDARNSNGDWVGLDALETVTGGVYFGDYANESCEGLGSLRTVGWLFTEVDSDMESFEGLDSLEYADIIFVNGFLHSLEGLERLGNVGSVLLLDNSLVPDLTGLDGLTTLPTLVVYLDEPAFVSFGGAPGLTIEAVYLGRTGIVDFASLPHPEGLVDLAIENNPELLSLDGLQGVSQLEALQIEDADSLTNLDGIETLTAVGDLELTDNATLGDISALHNLTSVSGDLTITGNPSLSQADAEALLAAIGAENVAGTVTIEGNGG